MSDCQDFDRRFHDWLDRRSGTPDSVMMDHAKGCEPCREQLGLWQAIESSSGSQSVRAEPSAVSTRRPVRFSLPLPLVAMGAAAVLLFAFMMRSPENSTQVSLIHALPSQAKVSADLRSTQELTMTRFTELDPVLWWHGLRQRDWVADTMPTVQTVRDSMAPLGRSLRRAFTLLATIPDGQTS